MEHSHKANIYFLLLFLFLFFNILLLLIFFMVLVVERALEKESRWISHSFCSATPSNFLSS